jgi:hypothetical protein
MISCGEKSGTLVCYFVPNVVEERERDISTGSQ